MAIDIRLYFDCTNKKTFVKDLTDYATEIPDGVTVDGLGTLLSPSQNLIINRPIPPTPIIAFDAYPRVSALYDLTSPIQAGQYTFNYSNYYNYVTSVANDQFITILTDNSFLVPREIAPLFAVGDICSITASQDSENDGTYTVTAIENQYGFTLITIDTNNLIPLDPIAPDSSANFAISKTVAIYTDKIYTYSACTSAPSPCVDFSYDCFTGIYGSGEISDATNYTGYNVESRTLSAYYPNALDPAPAENPITTDVAIINIGELATGTWSVRLSSSVSKAQEDGLILQSTINTTKEFNVACSSNMCGLSDCLTKLKDKHISYLKSSNISPLQQYVDNVQLLYTMAKEAQACGDKNAYSDYVSQIYAVLKKTESDCGCSTGSSCGCGCESSGSCGCGDQTPQWVNNIGVDINSLLADFENFMTNDLPTLNANVASLQNDMAAVQGDITSLQGDVTNLQQGLSTTSGQTNDNTTSIGALDAQINTPVTGLAAQVTDLQNQIAEFSPSNSEVALNEAFNRLPNTSQGVWKAINGVKLADTIYQFQIEGDVSFLQDKDIVFFNPPTQSWFKATVGGSATAGGYTQLNVDAGGAGFTSCEFLDCTDQNFPVFIQSSITDIGSYNFTKQFVLENDSYWKFEDPDNTYWSKLNITFACNSDLNINFKNETMNAAFIPLRTSPSHFIELEIIFEKRWTGAEYNKVLVFDIKFSGGVFSNGVNGIDLTNGGFSGFNPAFSYGIDLLNTSDFSADFGLGYSVGNLGCVLSDDIYKGFSTSNPNAQNSHRQIFRYATGPDYPENTTPQIFSGSQAETFTFNSLNSNITIFKFEQSFGKYTNPIA